MSDLISKDLIVFDLEADSKKEVISQLAERMDSQGKLYDKKGYIEDVLKREQDFSTAVGFSVATPHAKSEHVKEASIALARLKKEIIWDEEDNDMAQIVFQLAIPQKDAGDRHLKILAAISRKLIHEEFRERLKEAKDPQEILDMILDIK